MTTERIDIQIREDGSRTVVVNMNKIGATSEKTASAVDLLKKALAGLAAFLAVEKVKQYADAWAAASGQIRVATKSQEEAITVQERLFQSAQNTRTAFTNIVELYTRVARSGKSLGKSQEDLIQFSENIGKSLAVQGNSAEQTSGALLQLGQALGSGIVRAEEFNSVLEGAPYILQVVANNLKAAEGDIAKLRAIMLAGKLTSKDFFEAFQRGAADIDKDFKKSALTISQSTTLLQNTFMKFVGELDNSLGVSRAIGEAAKYIAANFDAMADAVRRVSLALGVGAAAWLAYQAAQAAGTTLAGVAAVVSYAQAVAAGRVVTLGSAEAEAQRAAATLASARADAAALAAQIALTDAEGVGAVVSSRAAAQRAAAAVSDLRYTQAQIAAERQLELVRYQAQISDIGRSQSLKRLIEVRQAELALSKSIAAAEKVSAEASAAAAAASAVQGRQAAANAQALATATQRVAGAQAASAAATAAAVGSTSLFAQALNAVKSGLTAVLGYLSRFLVLLNANPFVALAVALVGVTALLVGFGDQLDAGIDGITNMQDVMQALGAYAKEAFTAVYTYASEAFSGLGNVVADFLDGFSSAIPAAVTDWLQSFSGFYDGVGSGFAGVTRGIARTLDAIGGLLTGVAKAIYAAFAGLPELFTTPFKQAYNVAAEWIEKIINSAIDGINKVREFLGKDLLSTLTIQRAKVDDDYYKKYGEDIAKAFGDGFREQGGALEAVVNSVFDRAQQISRDRAKDLFMRGEKNLPADLTKAMGAGSKIVDEKELEKQRKALERLKNELRSLLNEVDPISGALLEQAKAFDILRKARAAGEISAEQHATYLERVRMYYKDILDPMGAMNREMERETALLGMSAQAREVEQRTHSAVLELRQKGVYLDPQEIDGLRKRFTALQELNRVTAEQDSILANSVGRRQQLADQMKAINALSSNSGINGFNSGDRVSATADVARNAGLDIEGTQLAVDAQIAQFQRMYDTIRMLREQNLIDEQTTAQLRTKVDIQQRELQFSGAQSFFGSLSQLSKSENSKLAAIGKAAAIAQATINTYQAATGAYSSLASIPYVGPALGAAAAAAAVAAGLANIAQIRSANTGFMTGGSFTVPGNSGGADSNMVAFRATPGERVSVQTPTQVRKGTKSANGGGTGEGNKQGSDNVKVVNLWNPDLLQDYVSSPAGEKVIVNVMQRNPAVIEAIVRGAN